MKRYKSIIIILFMGMQLCGFGQSHPYTAVQPAPLIQSPNASSLGQYGATEVSPFTGLANINIPVFSLQEGDIPVSASLSYNTGGVKPENHPGWTGQNWTLAVGGIVTRKQNGKADESPAPFGYTDTNAVSYYFKYSLLNTSSWASASFVDSKFPVPLDAADNQCDLSPDEFFFTLPNGSSGSFLLNHLGQWKVKSNQPGLFKVNVGLAYNFNLVNSVYSTKLQKYENLDISLYRIIYNIVITDADGFVYTFGNDANAIEFNRGPINNSPYNEEIIANAWHLTKIESPKGSVVEFVYQRKCNQYVLQATYQLSKVVVGSVGERTASGPKYSSSIITPSYLKEIDASSFKVKFKITESKELQYDYRYFQNGSALNGFDYKDITNNPRDGLGDYLLTDFPPKWYKLSEIDVLNNRDSMTTSYQFGYNNLYNERLFLQKFTKGIGDIYDLDGIMIPGASSIEYTFEYNTVPSLPHYCAMATDEWGYYNGIYFNSNDVTTPPASWLNNYFKSDVYYAKSGTLSKIHYPTGGSSTFEYELNNYGKVLQKNGNQINLVVKNGYGGGLRIKKIIDSSITGLPVIRTYDYTIAGVSSGILAGKKQVMIESVFTNPSASLTLISNNSASDLDYTQGKDVVYTQVKEIFQNGSYNIYKYTNSDILSFKDTVPVYLGFRIYNNSTPIAGIIDTSVIAYPSITPVSREMERGRLLSKETFNAAGKLVYKEDNEYRDDPARFGEYVRGYDFKSVTIDISTTNRLQKSYDQAIKYYYYFPYLKKRSITTYDTSGVHPVTVVNSYQYDHNYRTLRTDTIWDSRQQAISTLYKYPFDYTTAPYSNMVSKNILSPVIEQTQSKGGTVLQWRSTSYYQDFYNHFLPKMDFARIGTFAVDTLADYSAYDANANLQAVKRIGSAGECYLWGYNNQYPVVRVIGSSITAVKGFLRQSLLDSALYYSPDVLRTELNKVRTGVGASGQVFTYTYNPLVGMTSATDPSGVTTYYEYDEFGRLIKIKDQYGHIMKNYHYHYVSQSSY